MVLIMASVVCFFSCTESVERPHIPNMVSLKVGEHYSLGVNSEWNSSNPFSATVNEYGVIRGIRAGEATVSTNYFGLSCRVNVKPSYTLYEEPVLQWGISKNALISKRGLNYVEDNGVIAYKNNSNIAPIEMYLFENNKLVSSVEIVKTTHTEELVEHLGQRYKPAAIDNNSHAYYFLDGNNTADASMAVIVSLYNTQLWQVVYMPREMSRGKITRENFSAPLSIAIDSLITKGF